jgi:hypothetical protein
MLALRAVVRYGYAVPFVAIAFALLLAIAFIPLLLLVRFRLGSARRRARGWVATVNMAALTVSAVLLLISAAIVSVWIPDALKAGHWSCIRSAALIVRTGSHPLGENAARVVLQAKSVVRPHYTDGSYGSDYLLDVGCLACVGSFWKYQIMARRIRHRRFSWRRGCGRRILLRLCRRGGIASAGRAARPPFRMSFRDSVTARSAIMHANAVKNANVKKYIDAPPSTSLRCCLSRRFL